jgi:hypothetical protein
MFTDHFYISLRANNIKPTEFENTFAFSTTIGSFVVILFTSRIPCRHCHLIPR